MFQVLGSDFLNAYSIELLSVGSYRFFCYAGERDQLPHVPIERDVVEYWVGKYFEIICEVN